MKAVVSEKGQVTIPKRLRDQLGIKPGQVLEFDEDQGRIVARKAPRTDAVSSVYGVLKLGRSTDEHIAAVRGEPDRA